MKAIEVNIWQCFDQSVDVLSLVMVAWGKNAETWNPHYTRSIWKWWLRPAHRWTCHTRTGVRLIFKICDRFRLCFNVLKISKMRSLWLFVFLHGVISQKIERNFAIIILFLHFVMSSPQHLKMKKKRMVTQSCLLNYVNIYQFGLGKFAL